MTKVHFELFFVSISTEVEPEDLLDAYLLGALLSSIKTFVILADTVNKSRIDT